MASGTASPDRQARAARNQALFREVNERVEGIAESFAVGGAQTASFTCECANSSCIAQLSMTIEEYESLRASGDHFAVAPDEFHVFPDVERVVAGNDRYWVVEKIGHGGELAARFDPRARETV